MNEELLLVIPPGTNSHAGNEKHWKVLREVLQLAAGKKIGKLIIGNPTGLPRDIILDLCAEARRVEMKIALLMFPGDEAVSALKDYSAVLPSQITFLLEGPGEEQASSRKIPALPLFSQGMMTAIATHIEGKGINISLSL